MNIMMRIPTTLVGTLIVLACSALFILFSFGVKASAPATPAWEKSGFIFLSSDDHGRSVIQRQLGWVDLSEDKPLFFQLGSGQIAKLQRQYPSREQEISIHITQGRGLFPAQADLQWFDEEQTLSNTYSRDAWVMLRSKADTKVRLSIGTEQRLRARDYWSSAASKVNSSVAVQTIGQKNAMELAPLKRDMPFIYKAERDEHLKLDYYVDFGNFSDLSNVPVDLHWRIDEQPLRSSRRYANFDFRTISQYQCAQALSFKESLIVDLKEGQTVTFHASQAGLIGVSANSDDDYLFNRNRAPLNIDQRDEFEPWSLTEKWYTVLRAYNLPVPLRLTAQNNKLTTRRGLLPTFNRSGVHWLYSARSQPLDLNAWSDKNASQSVGLRFSSEHSRSNLTKLVLGHYHHLNDSQSVLSYNLPQNRVLRELELEIATPDFNLELIRLRIDVDDLPGKEWILVPGLQAMASQPSLLSMYLEAGLRASTDSSEAVSLSPEFARLKQPAPMVQTNYAYIAVPDSASKVSISLSNQNEKANRELWVSLRDFVYRSNLNDVAVLNENESKTIEQLLQTYRLFRRYEPLREDTQRQAAPVLDNILNNLEKLSFGEQRNLAQWARFFHVVRNARKSLEQAYIRESDNVDLNVFSDLDAPIWRNIEVWGSGPQYSQSLHILIGLTLHHTDPAVRSHALTQLKRFKSKMTANRLEQVLLAYLYQDMSQLGDQLSSLMKLWREQGKYYLMSLLPKPLDSKADYDLLLAASHRADLQTLQSHYDRLLSNRSGTQFDDSQILFDVARSLHYGTAELSDDNAKSYLTRFAFWKPSQQPVRQYTQHVNLRHKTRDDLVQKAFLVGENKDLILASNELRRYRIRVAPILTEADEKAQNGPIRLPAIIVNQQTRRISTLNESNWQALLPYTLDQIEGRKQLAYFAHTVGQFSTLNFSQEDRQNEQIRVTANHEMVVYFERLDDPAGLLQSQSLPLAAVDWREEDHAHSRLPSKLTANLSYPSTGDSDCEQWHTIAITQPRYVKPVRPSSIRRVNLKSPSTNWIEQYWSASRHTQVAEQIELYPDRRYDIATAANHLHWSENPNVRHRYPDLRANVFEEVRWRELLDLSGHSGIVHLQSKEPSALTQAESQRSGFSSHKYSPRKSQFYSFRVLGKYVQGVTLHSPIEQNLKVNVIARRRLFDEAKPASIWVQIGEASAREYQLRTGQERWLDIPLSLGTNIVKIWAAADSEEGVLFDFALPDNIQPIQPTSSPFFMVSNRRGITIPIRGPQRLKVIASNEFGQTKVREYHIPKGHHQKHLKLEDGYRYLRFFVLQENYEITASKRNPKPVEVVKAGCYQHADCFSRNSILNQTAFNLIMNAGFYSTSNKITDLVSHNANDRLVYISDIKPKAIEAEDKRLPTLGINVGWAERDTNDEDVDSTNQLTSDYHQLDAWYRQKWLAINQLSSVDASARRYNSANVYRLNLRHDWLEAAYRLPVNFSLGGEIWHQDQNSLNPAVSSGRIVARARYNREIKPRIALSMRGRAWYRASNADNNIDYRRLDSDVWSAFKEDHQYGLGLNQRATFRNALDSETYLEANLMTNEQLFKLDRHGFLLGWRSYFGGISGDINLNYREFHNDKHRERRFSRTDINLSTDWFLPVTQRSNFRLSARARLNTNDDSLSWWLNFGWFQHSGQQLFDLRPTELRFRSPRNWWLRHESNSQTIDY